MTKRNCRKRPYHGYIYLITNKINGKTYVGQRRLVQVTRTPETDGYMGSGSYLLNAKKKYGIENFNKEILAECYSSKILNILEIEFIKLYREIGKAEYNIAGGGLGHEGGLPMNEKTKEKIRKARSVYNPETGRKISEKLKGRVFTLEWRRHMSEAQSGENHPNYGKHLTEETKEKIRQGNLGKIVSEETREKIRKNNKSRTPEVKEKLRQANLGKHLTEETKEKLRIANKGKVISEEQRKLISEAKKGKPLTFEVWNKGKHGIYSEETLRKISEGHKGIRMSDESLEKMKKSSEGFVWWTNGVEETKARECPGEGWYRGRSDVYKRNNSEAHKSHAPTRGSKGMHWCHNETEEKLCVEITDGWLPGRLPRGM